MMVEKLLVKLAPHQLVEPGRRAFVVGLARQLASNSAYVGRQGGLLRFALDPRHHRSGALHGTGMQEGDMGGVQMRFDGLKPVVVHDAAAHQLPDGVGHVGIVAAEPVDPPDHEHVTAPEHVEQAPALRPVDEPGADAAHTLIRDHGVDREARGLGLGALVGGGLVRGRDAGVEDGLRHGRNVRWDDVRMKTCPLNKINPSGRSFGRSQWCPLRYAPTDGRNNERRRQAFRHGGNLGIGEAGHLRAVHR